MAAKRQHVVVAESLAALDRSFSAYEEILNSVRQFKYLGRIVSYDDNDTPAICRNIKKARWQWGQFSKVLERESVPPRVHSGHVLSSSRGVGTALWQQELGDVAVGSA